MICTLPLGILLCRSWFVHRLWATAAIRSSHCVWHIYLFNPPWGSFCVDAPCCQALGVSGFLRENQPRPHSRRSG